MLAGAKLDLLAQPIGERYRIMTSAIKAYPCISTAQTLVAGVLQARAGIAHPAREVKRIEVVMAISRSSALKWRTNNGATGKPRKRGS